MHYLVIVKSQGHIVAEHAVQAATGLAAIAQVESAYGEPVQVVYVQVELEDGRKQNKMVVNNWHGFSFLARRLSDE